MPKELVCDYDVILYKDNKETAREKIRSNYQRLNRVHFDSIECDTVEIKILNTNGCDSAEVFEIRIY